MAPRVLVTGGTGTVGYGIILSLLRDTSVEYEVFALVRNIDRVKQQKLLPDSVKLLEGDITNKKLVTADTAQNQFEFDAASATFDLIYHSAGLPEQYLRDESMFEKVNVEGQMNVLQFAVENEVRRVIVVSTMDVFACERGGTLMETNVDEKDKHTPYERSKAKAYKLGMEFAKASGLDIVFLNPAAVIGPSPVSTGLNAFICDFVDGKVPLLPPGGMPIVYNEDVGNAAVKAAQKAKSGESYLLGSNFYSNSDLADLIISVFDEIQKENISSKPVQDRVSTERESPESASSSAPSRQKSLRKPPNAPYWLLNLVARVTEAGAKIFGGSPLVSVHTLTFLQWQPRVDASKAKRDLMFEPTDDRQAVRQTILELRKRGFIKRELQ